MTHYEILGVNKNATQDEIKSAYKALIKRYHPDLYQGDKTFAEKKTKEINCAYDILSDPISRKEYDEEISPSTTYSSDNYTSTTYEYTPPKYDTPPNYYYRDYYKSKYSNNREKEYNYNDFSNKYRTTNRYSDYNQHKTQDSDYNEPISNEKSSKISKLIIIFILLIFYMMILIVSFRSLTSIFNGETEGALLNEKPKDFNEVIVTVPNENTTNENTTNTNTEFNINNYISEKELHEIYEERYTDIFDSYSEFREALSEYISIYYNF